MRQLVELIPGYLVPKLARQFGVDEKAHTFSPFSHGVALLYAQLSHALSLNDICDGLRLMATPLRALRGAPPPSRNALSHANKVRDCAMAEACSGRCSRSCKTASPPSRGKAPRLARRFRRSIHLIDSTVIELVSSCVDWANHNRRKAAIKCHLRLSLRSLLPNFAFLSSARENDAQQVRRICTGLQPGEVLLCDRGFHLLAHFFELTQRGVFFVTRALEGVRFKVVKRCRGAKAPRILKDEYVVASARWSQGHYPDKLRRVTARVQVDGQECELTFLTNNFTWSASSIADLYRCRWQIEAFFKQIKQTLQLADFPRPQCQCAQVADLDRAARFRAPALPSVVHRLGAQLLPAPHPAAPRSGCPARSEDSSAMGQLMGIIASSTLPPRAGCPVFSSNPSDSTACFPRGKRRTHKKSCSSLRALTPISSSQLHALRPSCGALWDACGRRPGAGRPECRSRPGSATPATVLLKPL